MRKLERVLKGLANRRRLAIVKLLMGERDLAVGDIAAAIRLSEKSTSKHLRILTHVGALEHDQKSRYMFYRIANGPDSTLAKLFAIIAHSRE